MQEHPTPRAGWLAGLPRTVIALGAVSFFTDASSEMIYPLLPVFLVSVLGAGAVSIGVVEGVAESTAALLKIASGIWTDRSGRRKPLVVAGYSLSSLMRPLIGLAGAWPTVLVLRFLDRVGKGLRSSPRDALIADVVPEARRGLAFGFHRTMDHAGSVAGPLLAGALLSLAGMELRTVFLLAALPGALAVGTLLLSVREPARPATPASAGAAPQGEFPAEATAGYRPDGAYLLFLVAMAVFTLGNSTDAFLLLQLSDAGLDGAAVATLWAAHHVVKMGGTTVGGWLSDRWGRRPLLATGWLYYAAVYGGFAALAAQAAPHTPALVTLFLLYGLYYGLTEPTERAWVADLVPARWRGRAFGWFHGTVGLTALPGSLLFGWLRQSRGAPTAFAVGALLALAGCLLLLLVRPRPREAAA